MTIDNTYNGWTNRETWLVGIWFNPMSKGDVDYLEETIEEHFIRIMEKSRTWEGDCYVGLFTDMIDFHCINWDELREAQDEEE